MERKPEDLADVVIVVSGGIVQSVRSRTPNTLTFLVLDFDNEDDDGQWREDHAEYLDLEFDVNRELYPIVEV